jgi:hypothetical protein
MRGWVWTLAAVAALALALGGCSGGGMLKQGDVAPALPAGLRMIDGAEASLSRLTAQGPLVLVLLRGFG